MTIDRKFLLAISSDVTGVLTILAALPYEIDLLALFPPGAKPIVAVVGALATVGLRIWKLVITARAAEATTPQPPASKPE